MNKFIRYYLVPGAIFQSSIIAGGYGTGREVMEYISRYGAWGGVVACLVAGLVFTVVLSLTWELARITKTYDYHSFTKVLLGRAWISYEALFICTLFLVQAVLAAAAGKILSDILPVDPWVGIILMLVVIVILNYFGRAVVVACMGITSVLVTVVLLVYCALAINHQPETMAVLFSVADYEGTEAMFSGAKFAMYNCLSIPVILYAVAGQESRRQTFFAGLFGGIFAMIPAVLLHLSFVGNISDLLNYDLPTYWMFKQFDMQWVTTIYLLVLFATVAQSGVGVLQGLNERIDNSLTKVRGRGLSKASHALIAAAVVLISGLFAQLGVVALIGQGYQFIAFGLFVVYLLPLLTLGLSRIIAAKE